MNFCDATNSPMSLHFERASKYVSLCFSFICSLSTFCLFAVWRLSLRTSNELLLLLLVCRPLVLRTTLLDSFEADFVLATLVDGAGASQSQSQAPTQQQPQQQQQQQQQQRSTRMCLSLSLCCYFDRHVSVCVCA